MKKSKASEKPSPTRVKAARRAGQSTDSSATMSMVGDEAALLSDVRSLAANLVALQEQAVREYTPLVESIVRSRSRDVRHIEHILDGLLGFCGHSPALVLYRRLCRHYFALDPAATAATAAYVRAYLEMWDSEDAEDWSMNAKPGAVQHPKKLGFRS